MSDTTPQHSGPAREAVAERRDISRPERSFWETARPISHNEADDAAIRLINSHFKNDAERARVSIPANPDRDDDLIIRSYIRQQARVSASPAPAASGGLEAVRERAAQICEASRTVRGHLIEYDGMSFIKIDDVNAELNRRAAEIRALAAPAATGGGLDAVWRDIKTAPKGRRVLVKFQSGGVEVCYQTHHGGGLMDSWRYAFARCGEQAPWPVEWCEIPAAIAATAAQHPDDIAVDRFAAAMKAKLAKKRDEGRGGWEDKDDCSNSFLSRLLREHVEKGDPVDVANFCMMLHARGEMILPASRASSEV